MVTFIDTKMIFIILFYFTLGAISWIGVGIYVILSTPIFIYRVFVTKLCVLFSEHIRKQIYGGQFAATDYLSRYNRSSYRSAILCQCVFKGAISPIDFYNTIEGGWVTRQSENGKLMFPEMQQYMHSFMGFMFWKQDEHFDLTNHIHFHDIGSNSTDESSEIFMCSLAENLLNKCFIPKKSPWEVHLVHNYKDSSVCNETMSVVIFWIHHAVGDGVSIFNVFGELMYEKRIEDLKMVIPNSKSTIRFQIRCVLDVIPNLLRTIYDTGYLSALWLQQYTTPWLVPDSVKANRQSFARTRIISVDKIKRIKTKFGVGFTAVVLSCLSAAISKSIKGGETTLSCWSDSLAVLIPIPIWSASKSLGVYSTGVLLDLPLTCDVDSAQRLARCQKSIESAKQSTLPFLLKLFFHLGNSNLAIISRFLARNLKFPIFVSIFPLPEDEARWNGVNALIGHDSSAGCQLGDAGVGVVVASYNGNARISITTEAAYMDIPELKSLMSNIENELQQLDNWNLDVDCQQV